MFNTISQTIAKFTLAGSAISSAAIGIEVPNNADQTELAELATASELPMGTNQMGALGSATTLAADHSNGSPEIDMPIMITKSAFEPSVSRVLIPGQSQDLFYYRFKKVNSETEADNAPISDYIAGPIVGLSEQERFENYLKKHGFKTTPVSLSDVFDNKLVPPHLAANRAPQQSESWWSSLDREMINFAGYMFILSVATGGMLGTYFLARRSQMFGSMPRRVETHDFESPPSDRFSNVGGCAHIVEEMREFVGEIKAMREGKLRPSQITKGIVFAGEPGAGKTLLARATAGEVNCPFLYINSAALVSSSYVGDWTSAILEVFKQARKARDQDAKELRKIHGKDGHFQGACILFIDEFDSVGSARLGHSHMHWADRNYNNVVNALLAEMDGVDGSLNGGVIVLAATNRVSDLDPALMRPGRFSKIIQVPVPITEAQRKDILERLSAKFIYPEGYSFASEQPFERLVKITVGNTGDYLRGLLIEAMALARRECVDVISENHLLEAFQRQRVGRAHESQLSEGRQELVAYHEHGHALVALACGVGPIVVSMVPRGATGGRVILDPNQTYQPPASLRDIMRAILIQVGGRAAELVFYGDNGITEGAASDIETCRELMRRALTYGMLEGRYSRNVLDPQEHIPSSYHNIVDAQIDKALTCAKSILKAAGKDLIDRLVRESRALPGELIGDDAKTFYSARVSHEIMLMMSEIVNGHLGEEMRPDAYGIC